MRSLVEFQIVSHAARPTTSRRCVGSDPIRTLRFAILGTALCLGWIESVVAADWPRWRGSDHSGISRETQWSSSWGDEGPRKLWKASVGTGFSAPAVLGDRLWVAGNDDQVDSLRALDATTGRELWAHQYDADLGDKFFDGGPTATPTVDAGRVYFLSRWGETFCLDATTGKTLWKTNVAQAVKARIPGWGFSGSPLVLRGRVILNVGSAGVALDAATGAVQWSTGAGESGYSSPLPVQRGERWLVLMGSGKGYAATDLETGRIVWEHPWSTRYGVNAADPIVRGTQLFLSTGYDKGCALLDWTGERPTVQWSSRAMRNQMSGSVLVDGFLYGIDGDTGAAGAAAATLKCLEWATGETRWSFGGVGAGSVLVAGDRLLVLSERGELLVGPCSPREFKPTARAQVLGGRCWTPPVLASGRLYCRNARGDLICLDLRGDSAKSPGPGAP